MTDQPQKGDLIFYQTSEGKLRIEVLYEAETFWLSQKGIAELFGVDVRTVNEHLQNIFVSGELARPATIRNFRIVQAEGARQVRRELEFYNLDAIISVGYRVSSAKATEFRIWATQTLREFITKGFVLDDERLKLNRRFGKDYFKELDRIVSMFLDYAENQASRRIPTRMSDWVARLDAFLKFNEYELSPDQLPG